MRSVGHPRCCFGWSGHRKFNCGFFQHLVAPAALQRYDAAPRWAMAKETVLRRVPVPYGGIPRMDAPRRSPQALLPWPQTGQLLGLGLLLRCGGVKTPRLLSETKCGC